MPPLRPGNIREERPGYIFGSWSAGWWVGESSGLESREEGYRPQFEGSRSSWGRTSQPFSPMAGRVLRGEEEVARRVRDFAGKGEPERRNGGEGDGSES